MDLSHFTWAGLEERIDHVRAAATDREEIPELNVLIQQVVIGDRAAAAESFATMTGADPSMLLDSPFLLLGSLGELVDHCERLRDLGVSSIAAFEERGALDLAPVIANLTAH